ncbi:MAG: DUF4271 domain-containing protein [Bacteroidales bacterium]|jgi:hypothetical protein|nr:DUF4271 domain-containing protein [Bacteroidales bacterium]
MTDSLNIFVKLNPWVVSADSTLSASDSLQLQAQMKITTFLQPTSIHFNPIAHISSQFDVLVIVVLVLLAGISVLRWYMPDRFYYEFSVGERFLFSRNKGNVVNAPGVVVDLFFWINFLFTTSLMLFLFVETYIPHVLFTESDYKLFLYLFLAVIAFWLYRRIVIKIISFIFMTKPMSGRQIKLDQNVENATGVVLLPVLLLSMLWFHSFFLIAALIVALGMQVFRWSQTVAIGISGTRFSAFHFILYLCSLELIPMIIILKFISLNS